MEPWQETEAASQAQWLGTLETESGDVGSCLWLTGAVYWESHITGVKRLSLVFVKLRMGGGAGEELDWNSLKDSFQL